MARERGLIEDVERERDKEREGDDVKGDRFSFKPFFVEGDRGDRLIPYSR